MMRGDDLENTLDKYTLFGTPRNLVVVENELRGGIYETARIAVMQEWCRGRGKKRNMIYLLGKNWFLQWEMGFEDNSIVNYDEKAAPSPYEKDLAAFVDGKMKDSRTAGFIAMDHYAIQAVKDMNLFMGRDRRIGFCVPKTSRSENHTH